MSISDGLTDLVCDRVSFLEEGYAHKGVLLTAQWFIEHCADDLLAVLEVTSSVHAPWQSEHLC